MEDSPKTLEDAKLKIAEDVGLAIASWLDTEHLAFPGFVAVGQMAIDEYERAMSALDRIARARELLAGTGRVVAKEVCVGDDPNDNPTAAAWARGWDACRAAMMATDGR